jgi:hypothetical protein
MTTPSNPYRGFRFPAEETYVKVKGRWIYLYRAVDSRGQTIDFLLSVKRDAGAAKRLCCTEAGHGAAWIQYPEPGLLFKRHGHTSGLRTTASGSGWRQR